MSFDDFERSNYEGIPTTLYEFALGNTARWRYATGTLNVTLNGAVFTAMPVSDTGIVQSGEVQNDDFTVTLPSSAPFTGLFIGTPPSQPIFLTVRNINRGDPEAPVVWAGTVKSGRRKSLTEFEIVCRTLTSSLNRLGVRLSWGRGCPHALYDRNCRVDKSLYGTSVQIASLSGSSLQATVGSLGNNYLTGGFLEFDLMPGVRDTRAIESHIGTQIDLLGSSDGLRVGAWITVYPGCNRIPATCENKFNNLANYGGFPHLPTKNPFDGDPIF